MIIDGITFAQRLKAAGVQVPEHTVSITIEAVPNDAVRVTYETVAPDEIVAACAEAALAAEAEGQIMPDSAFRHGVASAPMNEKRELLTDRSMAARLGVTIKWIRQEADGGRIPHLKAGGRILFNAEAVERLLTERAAKEGVRDGH